MRFLHDCFVPILQAFRTVFSHGSYWYIAAGASAGFFILPLLIPTWFIPADTFSFELHLMRTENYLFLSLFALLSGILLALNIFLIRQRIIGSGGTGIIAAFLGSVLLTSCGCGIGFILGFVGLGVGSTSFILANQLYIVITALCITFIGLYFSAKKVVAGAVCPVEIPR